MNSNSNFGQEDNLSQSIQKNFNKDESNDLFGIKTQENNECKNYFLALFNIFKD